MLVTLTNKYSALPYEIGTVENLNRTATAELSDTPDDTGGIVLHPGEKFVFNSQLYARSSFFGVKLAVVSSSGGANGGDGGDDSIIYDGGEIV